MRMDDPWANAWGEPATTSKQPPAPPAFPTPAGDDEEDITIPSWEQPSWSGDNSNSLWGARSPALDKFPSWHSPYDDIPLGKSSTSLPETVEVPQAAYVEKDQEEVSDPEPTPESPTESAPESPVESSFEAPFEPPLSSPILPPNSPPGSPDAFGTFETGLDELPSTSDPWSPSRGTFVSESADAAWGSAWAPSEVQEREDDAPAVVDEWEAAKQQKALQDKHVPPELLASLLLQFAELSNDLYPPLATPTPDPDDYRANRYKGLNGIESLNPTVTRLLPMDLTLPPPRPFLKSATAKHTAEALRLSRSAAFVRFSPLSHYGATKGSTAWEASVKRRPEPVADADLLPPGWRIVEKKEDTTVTDKKKPGHGGLLSFFGRRAATPPVVPSGEGAIPRSSSSPLSSPRASIDNSAARSPTVSTQSPTNSNTSAAPSVAASPTASSSSAPPPVAPVLSQSDSGADAEPVTPVSAPSAVSRFLGRFGRKAPTPAEKQNLALSEGDFDFLADIEGTAAGPSSGSEMGTASFAISGALLDAPVPLPAKLAPPPRPTAPVVPPTKRGEEGRPGRNADGDVDELAMFGKYTPPPSNKPLSPPLAPRSSAPTPTPAPVPAPATMPPPVGSEFDFSAWGFNDEDKSDGMARRDSAPIAGMNARAATNTRGSLPPPRRAPSAIMSAGSSATNIKGAIPPPRRAPTAIMSSESAPPAIVPKLGATTGFPPPPRTQTPGVTPFFPPPPGTKAAPTKQTLLLDDDNDEFSDFHAPAHSAPPPSTSANSFYDTSFSSSTSSDRGLFSSTSSASVPSNLFDDFDDFMQASPTTLRTPSPPRPPAKPARIPPVTPLTFAPPPDNDDTPLALIAQESKARSSLEAKRVRALSLVESAAATSGVRWPAPASPIPEAIAPPPDPSDPFNFNGASKMQSQQAAFLHAGPRPSPLKAFSPPPSAPSPLRPLSPPVHIPPLQKVSAPAPFFPPPPGSKPIRALSPPVQTPPLQTIPAPTPFFPPPPGAKPIRALSPPAQSQPPVLPPPQNGMARGFPPPLQWQTPAPAAPTLPPLTSSNSSGGLSAQDLSFFEGL
ncbi:hypothetical protein DFH06DRAFT_1481249 [Mycena polygramma]|nr:hypothetical protein DFH06DRAFT_1481249 [Mycena polygramma]